MDPMNALFSLYNIVDQNSRLDLFFTYTFKHPMTFAHFMENLLKRTRGKKKNGNGEEKPNTEEEPEIFGSFSYKIISKDKYLAAQLRENIKSAYAPFISNGKLQIKTAEKFIGLTHAQAENFFHIPTLANFVK